jgi:hypothetical protein
VSSSRARRGRGAARAEAADLDGLTLDREAQFSGAAQDRARDRRFVDFGRGAAFAADQELADMRPFRPGTADIGVERFDAMDEALFEQEVERAIDGGRRSWPRQTSSSTWRRSSVNRAPCSAQTAAARSSAVSTQLP